MNDTPIQERLEPLFLKTFHTRPQSLVRAPGRISLLGEHTDYNGGFVLPAALKLATTVALRVREDSQVRVHSLAYPDYIDSFHLTEELTLCEHVWANYIRGVFYVLRDYGFHLRRGFDLLIASELPEDAGLASSAALSTSIAGAVTKALNLPLDKRSLALIAQKAENEFMGKQCGVMDQLTAVMSKQDHLMLIDCEDFSVHPVPLPRGLSIVLFNSRSKKRLVGDEYNTLRGECERAASVMGVKSLRHATLDMLYNHKHMMNDVTFRRARHILSENDRANRVAQGLLSHNISTVYKLMRESHESMKNDFEIATPEINALVDLCHEELPGNVGARMTGGGFGGPVVALCKSEDARKLAGAVTRKYYEQFNINAPVHICRPAGGISILWLDKHPN